VSFQPLRTSLEKQRLLHEQILEKIPQHYRWQPVERFLKLNGMQAMMQVIAMAYDWNYAGRNETVKNTLDVISICCLCSKAQLLLTERFQLQVNLLLKAEMLV
jgi:HIV-1 Vpr-binding protein